MDFNALNTKDAAENGAFLHLKHPSLGHLLYNTDDPLAPWDGIGDEPQKVGVMVRGTESKTVKEQARAFARDRMTSPVEAARRKNNALDHIPTEAEINAQVEEKEESAMRFVCSLVISFVGLTDKKGQPLEATEANKRAFFEQSDNLVQQVITFAQRSSNFFSKG